MNKTLEKACCENCFIDFEEKDKYDCSDSNCPCHSKEQMVELEEHHSDGKLVGLKANGVVLIDEDEPTKEQTFEERFEDQSFIRVMKYASDFNRDQYELMKKLTFSFFKTEVSELLAEIEKCKKSPENLRVFPERVHYNKGLQVALALTKQRLGL